MYVLKPETKIPHKININPGGIFYDPKTAMTWRQLQLGDSYGLMTEVAR